MTRVAGLYRKRPVVVEALQWDGTVEDATELINWTLDKGGTASYVGQGEDHPLRRDHERLGDDSEFPQDWRDVRPEAPAFIRVVTPDAVARLDASDWLIRGARGNDFYPCQPDIFDIIYEKE